MSGRAACRRLIDELGDSAVLRLQAFHQPIIVANMDDGPDDKIRTQYHKSQTQYHQWQNKMDYMYNVIIFSVRTGIRNVL
jgi:hypothetical protein